MALAALASMASPILLIGVIVWWLSGRVRYVEEGVDAAHQRIDEPGGYVYDREFDIREKQRRV